MKPLGPDDAGTDIEVPTGGSFVVRLPENASTGYQWEVVERPFGVECIADRSVPARELTPGAASVHEFEFSVDPESSEPSRGQLVLHLRRSWETARAPVETFAVTLVSR